MDLLHTDDLEGSVKQLDEAFLAATASEEAEEHFLDLLDEALVTLYTHKKRVVCIGLEWMFQSLDNHDNFVEQLRKMLSEITDAFLEASEVNTRILDVTCSALLQLVPQHERLGFCRTLILHQGPHCKQWVSNLSRHGIDNEDIADLLFDVLEDEETTEACSKLIRVMTANRRTDKVDQHPEFLLLGTEEFQIAAELCAEHEPAKVLETLQGKFWDGHDQTQGFTWQVNHLLGTEVLDKIIAVAIEACGNANSKVDYIGQLYKRTVRNRGIDVLIRDALERNNKTYFDSHMAQCLANSQDRLILLYQTELYKLLHEHATSLAWYIDERLRDAMANMGWHVAYVSISMHQHRPSRYVELDGQRYIQPFSDRFFPKRGEEVLFNPSTGKQLGARTHAASFLKIER